MLLALITGLDFGTVFAFRIGLVAGDFEVEEIDFALLLGELFFVAGEVLVFGFEVAGFFLATTFGFDCLELLLD